jgi:hypothetical protein
MIRAVFELFWWLADGGWRLLRAWSGDDAYERYLARRACAGAEEPVLTRAAFFARHIEENWRRYAACGRSGDHG